MPHPWVLLAASPPHSPQPTPQSPAPGMLWHRLDPHRRRLFAQRLALLLHRRHAAPLALAPEVHNDR